MPIESFNRLDEKRIKFKIFLTVFLCMFFALTISEYLNAFFNTKYDNLGISSISRIKFAFKPTVMALYVVFSSIMYLKVVSNLKPLFNYLKTGKEYKNARKAAVKIPWFIINFQLIAWPLGTTVYYILKEWNPDSGIPFYFGLMSKFSTSVISALYIVFLINIILHKAKQSLNMTNINSDENDSFSRYKDYIANFGIAFYLIMNLSYIAFYFASKDKIFNQENFLILFIPVSIILFSISYVPIILGKKEYSFQIKILKESMANLVGEGKDFSGEINLINFDELGELAVYVNNILIKFRTLFDNISSVVIILSKASETLNRNSTQGSSLSNQQAAATAEIVATMEDSNSLSNMIGDLAKVVSEKSGLVNKFVSEGSNVINKNLESNSEVKSANETTINFIHTLSSDIKSINDVVKMINGIADQIKIIAFNAELEASAAGEAGKNFEIVATEIRRLADSTVSSTTEIKEKINIIEKGANSLVNASVNATELIEHSYHSAKEAQDIFKEINHSSKETVSSSNVISKNILMQIAGYEQILVAIKQIAEGVSNSAESAAMGSDISNNLQDQVDKLKDIIKNK